VLKVALRAPTIDWLRKFFSELHTKHRQVGLDDILHKWYAADQKMAAEAVATNGSIPENRRFARTGVPSGHRPRVWANALGCPHQGGGGGGGGVSEKQRAHLRQLIDQSANRPLLSDMLVRSDAANLSDDPSYFVFEDHINTMMMAFTRDSEVPPSCAVPPHPHLLGRGRGGADHGSYPPSGVLPFLGLSCYAAPMCFLYPSVEECYFVFRALYQVCILA
jgi:hypothetical protein